MGAQRRPRDIPETVSKDIPEMSQEIPPSGIRVLSEGKSGGATAPFQDIWIGVFSGCVAEATSVLVSGVDQLRRVAACALARLAWSSCSLSLPARWTAFLTASTRA